MLPPADLASIAARDQWYYLVCESHNTLILMQFTLNYQNSFYYHWGVSLLGSSQDKTKVHTLKLVVLAVVVNKDRFSHSCCKIQDIFFS